MKILLDTHTLLWFIEGDPQLSTRTRELIEDTQNDVLVSVASLFEIAIKIKIGKLSLQKSLDGFLRNVNEAYIEILHINSSHLSEYQRVPWFADHRDPFDRLIIASAAVENAVIITADPKFRYYADMVQLIW